jgi:predicted ATPase
MQHLSESARALWRRLSIFSGDCSRKALEAVAAGEGLTREEVAPLLAQLISQKMILVDESHQEPRYRLSEALRQEAWAQLNQSGEVDIVFDRLVSYSLTLAEQVLD